MCLEGEEILRAPRAFQNDKIKDFGAKLVARAVVEPAHVGRKCGPLSVINRFKRQYYL